MKLLDGLEYADQEVLLVHSKDIYFRMQSKFIDYNLTNNYNKEQQKLRQEQETHPTTSILFNQTRNRQKNQMKLHLKHHTVRIYHHLSPKHPPVKEKEVVKFYHSKT